ncbi:MAG TPA: peptide ABC transporter substrate-binding protein [Gemmatimonas sp.]|nr:peptide ABC transporter substrate-binding protein [Gemmatimonas sp.]
MLRAISRFAPIALLLAVCTSCGGTDTGGDSDTGTGAGSDIGGTLIEVQPAEPSTLFPPKVSGNDAGVIVGALFDRLANIGPALQTTGDQEFTPALATGWSWGQDSLSIAFTLDPKMRWHDGAPVRAKDVQFTFATYTAPEVEAVDASVLGNIDSVSVRDSLTPVFWFKRRLPYQFFDATYHMYILPSHLLDTIAPGALKASAFARAPIGTGRFRFVSWTPKQRIEIIADTLNARGRAKLDRVYYTFTSDYATATVKLFADEADFYEGIRPVNIPQVQASSALRLEPMPTLRYEYMAYNLRQKGDSAAPHPLFGDVNVRRALAMAVDRASLARNVHDTLGAVALSAGPRTLIPDSAALKQIPYDPTAARKLLDSLGWVPSAKDGIRERNGVRFSFELMAPSSSQSRVRFTELLQQQFLAIGVEARPVVLEGPAMGGRVMAGDFDTFVNAWNMKPGRLGMAQTWRTRGVQNYGRYASPEFDRMLDSAMTSLRSDLSAQRWTAVFQRLIDDQPGLWLAEASAPAAIHRRIRNAPLSADGWQRGLADWSVDPAQRLDRDKIGLRSAR